MNIRQLKAWRRLSRDYPWPEQRPEVAKHSIGGWLNKGTAKMLREHMSEKALVVELGTWRGLSARRMLDRMGAGRVICVDHWKGSEEHITGCFADRVKELLPQLYETFLHDTWRWRARIIPLRMDTLDGLHTIYEYGLVPDLIYVDAGHEFRPVFNDIAIAATLFPQAIIVGDDWYIEGIKKAGKLLSQRLRGYEFLHNVKSFCFKPSI